MYTVNYSHRGYESARIPLKAWLGDYKLLKVEIFQVNNPAAVDLGTSNGVTIVGRTQVPIPEDYFRRFRHRVEVVKMVRGVLKKIGTIDVELQKRRIDVEFERQMKRKEIEERLEQKCRKIEMEREQRRIEMEHEIRRLMEMRGGRRGVSMFDNLGVYYQLQQLRRLISSLYNQKAARQLTSDIEDSSDSDEPLAASSPSEPTAQWGRQHGH
ncbi:hypothetical protein FRX31_028486 [Thalictrum thalictroides]|uniref:Uncharacterized protein n=1 Tax=Thalictrum thalictroides TaxID=46969 RepID=A0A7J6VBA1_THATH|nr:hypothetical protein FRX31_028486 [Thalictrum thalictroides]